MKKSEIRKFIKQVNFAQAGTIVFIVMLGLFLRLYRISEFMTFIGDQGWFYLSARDLILFGKIPLVGIASSHPWLHQGPVWTYMLAFVLFFFRFNPISGAYLSAFFDVLSIFLIYKIGKDFFSEKIGIFAALLFATSPAMVFYSRMPYHTSPIPFFVLLFLYSLLAWVVKKKSSCFPIVVLSISILYNLELATIVFAGIFLFYISLGYYKKKNYIAVVLNKKTIIIAFIFLITPLLPILLYDFSNGFSQTLKFGVWIFYKILQTIQILPRNELDNHTYVSVFNFFINKYQILLFPNFFLSIVFLIASLIYSFRKILESGFFSPISIVSTLSLTAMSGYLIAKTPSDAYLPMIFPSLIFLFAMLVTRVKGATAQLIIIIIALLNSVFIIQNYEKYTESFWSKITSSKQILSIAGGKKYNLIYDVPGKQFENSIMDYEYLTWWIGRNPPVKDKVPNKIRIRVTENKVTVDTVK